MCIAYPNTLTHSSAVRFRKTPNPEVSLHVRQMESDHFICSSLSHSTELAYFRQTLESSHHRRRLCLNWNVFAGMDNHSRRYPLRRIPADVDCYGNGIRPGVDIVGDLFGLTVFGASATCTHRRSQFKCSNHNKSCVINNNCCGQ